MEGEQVKRMEQAAQTGQSCSNQQWPLLGVPCCLAQREWETPFHQLPSLTFPARVGPSVTFEGSVKETKESELDAVL